MISLATKPISLLWQTPKKLGESEKKVSEIKDLFKEFSSWKNS